MAGTALEIRARHIDGDVWEVYLPRRRNAVRGMPELRPRHRVHAGTWEEAVGLGGEIFAREDAAYRMGLSMKLSDWALFHVGRAEATGVYSRDTAADYRAMLMRYVVSHFSLDVDAATPADIERLYSFLLSHGGRDGGPLDAKTVRKLHIVLRGTYGLLEREGIVPSSPMGRVRLPRMGKAGKRSLTARELDAVLRTLEGVLGDDGAAVRQRNMAFGIYLDIWTGARVGEICALTRGSVAFDRHAIVIDGSMSERGGLHRKEPKTAAGRRTVSLGDEPFAALGEHILWQATYLTEAQRRNDSTPLCADVGGLFIRPSDMSAAFKGIAAESGVDLARGESMHVLRHTHATQLLSNKENPELVRERMGHSRIETTYEYGHVMPGEDEAVAGDFGRIVARAREAASIM